MWDEVFGWKWDLFANYLPQVELQKIASFSLSPDSNLEDTIFWKGTTSGRFSIKSALAIIKSPNLFDEPDTPVWRVIWRLPVQQRIRMFLWLATHGRLMHNVNRVRRGMGDDSICPRCHSEEESSDHLLYLCPVSRNIWSQVSNLVSHNYFYNSSYIDWMLHNASNNISIESEDWSMQFAITYWWIWRWQNNVVFGHDEDNPIDPKAFLFQQFASSKSAFDRFSLFIPQPGLGESEVYIRWHPPPHGWTILNTDGASKGNPGPAGSGGIFRDETGNFIDAFFFSCGYCTSMKAELMALEAGLERARSLHIDKLLIHMDNSPCIKLIHEEQLVSNTLRSLVKRCKDLLFDNSWKVELKHCYREANRAANWLANQGVGSSIAKSFVESPSAALRTILREDILGVAIPRVIAI